MNAHTSKAKPAFSWRLIYAFVIVWLAGFAILSPLTRRSQIAYRSDAEISYTLNSNSSAGPDQLLSMLKKVVGQVTQPEQIALLCDQVAASERGTNHLTKHDPIELIQRMRIAQHNQEGKLTLSVSLNGSGTRDEQAFVNLLASTLAIEVPRQSDQAALTRWIENGATALDMSKQVNLAEQIRAEVSQTSGMIKELKDRFAATDVNALAAMIEKLETQKSELKSAKGLDDAHPEIVQLQSQIEELRGRMLSDPDFRPVQRGSIADTESGDVIKNRFYQASAKLGETKPTPADFATALSELDLSPIGALATQLKTHAESIRDLQQDIDTNLIEGNRASDSCIASLTGVSYSTRPTLLAETSTLPPWLLVVPCLFAAMVSLYYNPIRDRLQLKSIDDVVKSLGVGIIGEMPSTQPVAATTRGESWSAVSVRMAEYSLLAIGGLMLISCVMRPQILAAVLSNPILALANWFWLIVS